MFKGKVIIFVLSALVFTGSLAYCQEKSGSRQAITIAGVVAKVDAVGNLIEVKLMMDKWHFPFRTMRLSPKGRRR